MMYELHKYRVDTFLLFCKKKLAMIGFHGLKLVQWVTFFAVFLLYFGMLMEPKILKSDITQRVFVMTILLMLSGETVI